MNRLPHARENSLLAAVFLAFMATAGLFYVNIMSAVVDGLMSGLHERTGRSLRLVRTCIELTVMAGGFALGGKVGVGTVAFALLIGPGVQAAFGWSWPRMQRLR